MTNTIKLEISLTQAIVICLPCDKNDIYSVTNVSLRYIRDENEYDLFVNDYIIEALKSLNNILTKALNCELEIKGNYIEKGVGYFHNIYAHELWTTDNFDVDDPAEDFLVWSTPTEIGNETYIYNIQDHIHLEISPLYKWNSNFPDDESEYQTFEEFMNQHKIIDRIHIKRGTALLWQKVCQELMEIAILNDRK